LLVIYRVYRVYRSFRPRLLLRSGGVFATSSSTSSSTTTTSMSAIFFRPLCTDAPALCTFHKASSRTFKLATSFSKFAPTPTVQGRSWPRKTAPPATEALVPAVPAPVASRKRRRHQRRRRRRRRQRAEANPLVPARWTDACMPTPTRFERNLPN
jgi:hypothetical protein